ncbi:MAG: tRNA (guanosine(37)-N1)-methyltransferase TrmD [Bacilli bacterium]|nr:tRNA (guanosine(37)-N1)-methyltransferase TrmD [Bacilli bacterium]
MIIDILTILPNMFDNFLSESIIKRAIEKELVNINIHNIRDYSSYNHKQVDDTPYGGGSGMVLMCDPIFKAVEALRKEDTLVIMMTPQGETYSQKKAYELSIHKHIIIICGHYEGFDERILSLVDLELSIGDYVLTGGELPSMIVTDSIVRLIDGVINTESHLNDSFNDNLLDYPTYTKPRVYNGMEVPDVLLSGHHENIEKWRMEQRIKKTKEKRPDLMEG